MKKINLNINLSLGIGKLNDILSRFDSVEDYLYDLIEAESQIRSSQTGDIDADMGAKSCNPQNVDEQVQSCN